MDYVFHSIDHIVEKVVSELRQQKLYDHLLEMISAGLLAQQEKKPSQSINSPPKPVHKPKHGASSVVEYRVPIANRFALLDVEESESSDSDDHGLQQQVSQSITVTHHM